MSNILICYYSSAGNSKYQDLADSLFGNGNNVLQWNINGTDNKQNNADRVIEFKPDLVFSYNNCLPKKLFLSLECPILIVDADNPEMFWNKELLKSNKKNIYYLGYQTESRQIYKKILDLDIPNQNYLFFPPASNFKSESKILSTINISFIGFS